MTRKDYVAFAAIISREIGDANETEEQMGIPAGVKVALCARIARSLAMVCKRDNPAFDRDRFLKACGVE